MSFSGPLAQWHMLRRCWLGVSAGLVFAVAPTVDAREYVAEIAFARLPAEAQVVHRSILGGGPFRHAKDAAVFGNREQALPGHRRGYYREYTVPTPGANDRGARRIVCGGFEPKAPDACYYTADHYTRFYKILP